VNSATFTPGRASPADVWTISSAPGTCGTDEEALTHLCSLTWTAVGQLGEQLSGTAYRSFGCWYFSIISGTGRMSGATSASAADPQFPSALGVKNCTSEGALNDELNASATVGVSRFNLYT
jgi:hypothetical protein